MSKKALDRAKAKPKKAPYTSGEANAGIAKVQAGPVRTQTRLEKAYYVAKESTSRFYGAFQAWEFCSAPA